MNLFSFIEKRKQIQLYTIYNFLSSSLSYFDFTTFQLLENFQEFTILKKTINSNSFLDILLFSSFFIQKNNYFLNKYLKRYLKKYNRNKRNEKLKISIFDKFFLNKNLKISNLFFPNDLKYFYEDSINKSVLKYKNPIINSEIFILTSITQNPAYFKNILKFFIKNKKQWFILKYKLIRSIYFDSLLLQKYVKKNLWHYTYLIDKYDNTKKNNKTLKKSLKIKVKNSFEFMKKIFGLKRNYKSFSKKTETILNLRALLFSYLLKSNFQKIVEDDIILNIKNTKNISSRNYKFN